MFAQYQLLLNGFGLVCRRCCSSSLSPSLPLLPSRKESRSIVGLHNITRAELMTQGMREGGGGMYRQISEPKISVVSTPFFKIDSIHNLD